MSDLGKNFEQNALEQMRGVMLGGDAHTIAATTAIVAGESLTYGGPPGASKTKHMRAVPKLISGIESDEIAELAPLVDLESKDVLGFYATNQQGEKVFIPGDITPKTRVLLDDDASRKNPYTQNALLGLKEDGYVLVAGGKFAVDLVVSIDTLNASKPGQAVFKKDDANASRGGAGTIFQKTDGDTVKQLFGRKFNKRDVTPIISLEEVETLKQEAAQKRFADSTENEAERIVNAIVAGQESVLGLAEAGARIAIKLGNLTAARLVLSNEADRNSAAEMEALHMAAGMIIDGRVSALSSDINEDAAGLREMAKIATIL